MAFANYRRKVVLIITTDILPVFSTFGSTSLNFPQYKQELFISGLSFVRLLMVTALFAVALLITNPVIAETLPGEITEAQAERLSDPLKTFICADKYSVPEWCEKYRKAKFSNSIADWIKARDEARKALEAKKAAEAKAAQEAAVALAKRQALEAAQAAAIASNDPVALARAAKAQAAQKAEEEAEKISKAWSEFMVGTDVANLTMDQIMVVRNFASSASLPEANEILGFAYSSGSKALPANLAEAYRQYGQAYLKGLKRVKPNLDRIWRNIPREQQLALASEFK
ncbi:MAG: hypothetical protein HN725_08005 [Alphaproteobacteria bacterium]|jgi:hypothetical protein|nr:hypothetical protein [Alphaproteobacteria bacterium]MBT7745220.1 hypothetical protein [Alphaproteobacteria bacterium]